MDFAESAEHRDLRAAVASIASGFGPQYYVQHAAEHAPCDELWTKLGEAGFIGVNIPAEYGGGGGGLTELALVCEELGAQGTPLLLLVVSAAISAEVITRFGTGAQRSAWLPGLAAGTTKMVFAITEPDAGSNTHRLSTTATRDGDGWVLRGTKYYISGVDEADALLVVARTGPAAPGHLATAKPRCRCSSSLRMRRDWSGGSSRSICCCLRSSSRCISTTCGSVPGRWSAGRARGSGRSSTG